MITVRLPDGRTVQVQTSDPQEAAKAGRRLLAREAIQKSGMGAGRKQGAFDQATSALASGATLGLSDVSNGAISAGITGAKNLMLRAQGKTPTYGMGDAYAAERTLQHEHAAEHPVASGVGGLLGGLAIPGAEQVANFVAKGTKGATGLLGGVLGSERLPAVVARGAVAGAPLGAVSGATTALPGQEASGAKSGAVAGAAMGAALPVAGAAAGKVAGAGKGAVSTIVRATNKATGGKILDPQVSAAKTLSAALKADGATPDQLKAGLNTWLKTGASSPSLMDLATQLPSGGANTMRLLTGSAMRGKAAGMAGKYADGVTAALPDNVIARARKLTPDTRPATEVADDLTKTQRSLANEQYAEPYATPVAVTPELHAALKDEPGQAAVRRAIKGAVARQDYDAAGRLGSLLHTDLPDMPGFNMDRIHAAMRGGDGAAPVTAGDLDRIRIAMAERGEGALRGQAPARDVAGGLFGRAKQIDASLEEVPNLQTARQTYKAMQGQRDALETGQGAMSAFPDDYAAEMQQRLSMATPDGHPNPIGADDIRSTAAIGHRQAITDAVGSPAAGATGTLNKLANSPNQIRNQDISFGPEDAGSFRDAVNNEITRAQNARRIDNRTGSQTATRLDAMVDAPGHMPRTIGQVVLNLAAKVRQGATLTDDERAAVLHLGLSSPDEVVGRWHDAAQPVIDALQRSGGPLAAPVAALSGRRDQ